MKNIHTLVEDIHHLVLNGRGGDADVDGYLVDLGMAYKTLIVPENKVRKPDTLYFSEIGTPCKRKLWYKVHYDGVKEQLAPHTRIKFGYGHILEALVLQLARDAGHTVEDEQRRVEWVHPSGWRVSGRIDAVVDGVLVDVKSVSKFGKKKFEDGLVDDPFGYKAQLNGYATVLKNESSGFLTIEKELGHIDYFHVGSYDEHAWQHTVDEAVNAVSSATVVDRTVSDVPQSKTSKNMKLDVQCSYCEFKGECWKDANNGEGLRGFIYSNKVEWLTQVVDTPRVPEIDYGEIEDEQT